jgi:3-oxoacyl-[acyl-carrier protein] reductase
MPFSDKKRVIIITGASRGLGKAIALRFGRAGERVVVNFHSNENAARDVADEVLRIGGKAIHYGANVKSAVEVETMVSHTLKLWGSVDVLINNAAVTKDRVLLSMNEKEWDDVSDTNLSGPFHCIRAASDHMVKQRSGHIINIASIAGLKGREGQANYSATKAGLIGLTKAVAKELGLFNIKVNAVLPGYMPTDMAAKISNEIHKRILRDNTLGRGTVVDEVSNFIYQLSLMRNVSGQVFNLDSRIL